MNFNYFTVFLTISSNNLELLTNFYSQIFARPPEVYRPLVYTEFRLSQFRLGIFQPQATRQQEFQNCGSSMSLCIEVPDLPQAIATLTDMGYPPPGEIIKASHGQEIYAYDPEGNRLILHQSLTTKKPEIA